eukprot:CAMPEP_0202956684 /NCGR_PEP_ID=MMETSP1396-20130829/1186_1 /ASSEMBLY_ACC=CAM_ASM_000872 /TAXON_ID= /ORGANISM="Pseudokeronopsis sp., Strain Brazil" /LENGTH=43 /DNA_ID= /DNA_START= /DNA_END= /DNA_ORIENTATION=
MADAHGMEVGGGMMKASNGQVNNGAQQQDINDMQAKLDQLKHL